MVGDKYWSVGIIVKHHGDDRWSAKADFLDNGLCQNESTEGTIRARYIGGLRHVIDLVKRDAERLGIQFGTKHTVPSIWYYGDEEYGDYPPPEGWRELLQEEANRLGWHSYS